MVLIAIIVDIRVRTSLGIEKKRGWYKHVNQTHKWAEIILIIGSFTIVAILGFVYRIDLPHYIFWILGALYAFRTFVEWKYNQKSKQYILTFINSILMFVLFIGLLLLSYPKEMTHFHTGHIYTENGMISESVELEIDGVWKRNLIYGEIFEGTVKMLDKEFITFRYDPSKKESLVERLLGKKTYYTIIDINSGDRGELWILHGSQAIAGTFNTKIEEKENYVIFAGPADTLEEAKELVNQIAK